MPPVCVRSEIGSLRSVLVHTPGKELLAVTPGTREEYLYDDIIDLESARMEHDVMVSVLDRFANVLQVRDLLRDVLRDREEAREILVQRAMELVPWASLPDRLRQTPADDLLPILVEGDAEPRGPFARALNEGAGALPPLPNLFFTRDVGIVLGEQVLIGAMRYEARWSEEVLIGSLFRFHPLLANRGILYDGSREQRIDYSLEGGDVHPVREDLLIVGVSDRTSAAALDELCELVFADGKVTDVIAVVMPGEPTAIHLDMLFTQVDREVCVVSPPHFLGPERLAVLHRRKGEAGITERPDFFDACDAVDFHLEPVMCGGPTRAMQEREQWASGCNLLTLRPGVALAYRRNERTLAEFEKFGFDIVDAVDLDDAVDDGQRRIITFRGSELVRGGGGPRCMTLPLEREDL